MDQDVQFRSQPSQLEVGLEALDVVSKRRRIEPRELAIGAGVEVTARASEQEGRGVSEARARKLGASVATALDRGQDLLSHDERPAQRADLVRIGGRTQIRRQHLVGRGDPLRIDVERRLESLGSGFADVGAASGEANGTEYGGRSAALERRHLARVVERRSGDVDGGLHPEPTGGAVDSRFGVRLEVALTHTRTIVRTDIINF